MNILKYENELGFKNYILNNLIFFFTILIPNFEYKYLSLTLTSLPIFKRIHRKN